MFGLIYIFLSRFTTANAESDYPVQVKLRQDLYFQASVKSKDKRLSVLAEHCYATPYQNRIRTTKYNLIRNGSVLPLEFVSMRNFSLDVLVSNRSKTYACE